MRGTAVWSVAYLVSSGSRESWLQGAKLQTTKRHPPHLVAVRMTLSKLACCSQVNVGS
eukprot:CAMPEP_0184403870 /NCGR_PEP_ID=MMETSP0007-20130409/85645_1 /TAXON_ID=97485 /ORGANISM="Prymnesium parvum, Strain Texoma1" /LENGTH=57 /DNA_ID=CAMNT_0026760003 /DNA_START=78 /DNA_END=251 /DNA_ORIENTATION=+